MANELAEDSILPKTPGKFPKDRQYPTTDEESEDYDSESDLVDIARLYTSGLGLWEPQTLGYAGRIDTSALGLDTPSVLPELLLNLGKRYL
jgi:hypothetical protein